MFRSPRGIPSISTKKNGVATVQIGDTHSPVFGLHASQTNGITLAFPLLGGYGFSETSKHSISNTLSLYLVVTSVHVSHHRRDPPSSNTTRTSGVCLYFLHDNHRKLGGTRTRLSACCCCCCVSWLRPPQAFSKPRA